MSQTAQMFVASASWDWGSVPDWVVAITAVFGAAAVVYQLRAIRQSNEVVDHSNRLESLQIRLELDREFENSALNSSRQRLFGLSRKLSVERTGAQTSSVDLSNENVALVSERITEIWKKARSYLPPEKRNENPADAYLELMRFPYWLETIGHCCRSGLLDEAEFLSLYDVAVVNTISQVIGHIQDRRKASNNPQFLENAVWLYERAIESRKSALSTTVSRPR